MYWIVNKPIFYKQGKVNQAIAYDIRSFEYIIKRV